MPLVQVYRDKKRIGDELLLQMKDVIPKAVAKRLTSTDPEATLSPNEISVVFHDFGQFDVRGCSLEVIIFANHYPNRGADINERARLIARDLHECVAGLPTHNFFVYVILGTGGFFQANYTKEQL